VLTRTGEKMEDGLLYLHIDPEGCFVAAGFHMPEPPSLTKLRKAIATDPKGFAKLTATLKKGGLALGTESQMKRLPRGFEALKGSPVEGAVRLRSFIVEEPLAAKAIASPKLTGEIVDFAVRAGPLLKFGWAALD
jgi:uncharacterized protein (TIGR02453 family)